MRKRWIVLILALAGCVTARPDAQKVRVTNNPEIVRPCTFLGNVRAMSILGSGGLGRHNIEETLKQRTHELGGNVVYVVDQASGDEEIGSATGEAYLCR